MSASATPDETFVLNDLPIADDRDGAWRLVLGHGREVIELPEDTALTSQRAVEQAMRNPETFSSQRAFAALNSPLPLVPLTFDPPEHTRYRRILQPFFSPRTIRPLEDELRRQVAELLDPIVERGECEFIAEVADIFPVQTFLTFFGLPPADLPRLMAWKEGILNAVDASGLPTGEGDVDSATALGGYLFELVAARRGVPGPDVLSRLLALEGEDAITDLEAIGLCFLFVLAGLDTVTGSLGFGMERLARNPERRQELVDDPGLIPAAVEELVRLDPPAPFVPRMTTAPTTVAGVAIPADRRVTNHLALANRDESLRSHPFEMDFHRGDNPHASFGLGPHRCLGSHLARLEMRLVYEEWHKRIPHYEVSAGTPPRTKWPRGTLGLESLHLTVTQG